MSKAGAADWRQNIGGRSDEEVLEAVRQVSENLAQKHAFAYYAAEDIAQEVWVEALLVLSKPGKYDPSLPLANFLYRHVSRRLLNIRRRVLFRNDTPCLRCHTGKPCGEARCAPYEEWLRCNTAKTHLACPLNFDDLPEDGQGCGSTAEQDSYEGELLALIDAKLPSSLRSDYLRLKDHAEIPQARREAVERCVREILRGVVEVPDDGGRAD